MSEICDKLCGLILEGKWADSVLLPLCVCLYVSVSMYTYNNSSPRPTTLACSVDVTCLRHDHPRPSTEPKHLNESPGKPELRDIYSIGLKTLIADVPEEVRFCVYI